MSDYVKHEGPWLSADISDESTRNLTRHQLTRGWWHYKQTLLDKSKKQ